MKKTLKTMALLLLLTACGKAPMPNDVVTTNSRDNNGTTYIQKVYGDGSEQYFKVLSDNTAEVVRAHDYYGIEPPIEFGSNTEVIPSEITYDGQVYTIVGIGDYAFYDRRQLSSVEIPNTVTYVGERAFDFCLQLKTIKLPDGVTQIEKGAFRSCVDLTTVEMGSGMASIHFDAFGDCRSLSKVVCRAVTPPEILYDVTNPSSIFWKCPISEIKVPAESVEAYKAASLWSAQADKIVAL